MGESTEKKGDGVGGSGRWEADPNGPEHVFWKLFPRVFARLHSFPLLHYVSRFTAEHHGYFPLRVSLHPPDMGIGLASSLNCPLHGAYPSRAQHHSFRLSGFYKENLETLNGPASAFRLYRRPPSSFPSEMVALALKAQRHTQMVD